MTIATFRGGISHAIEVHYPTPPPDIVVRWGATYRRAGTDARGRWVYEWVKRKEANNGKRLD